MIHSASENSSKRKRTLWQEMKSLRGQQVVVTITFLLVPVLLLVLFTYLPFAKMIQFSFFDMKYIGRRTFVGLENYLDVFTRKEIFQALKLAVYYMGASVVQISLALFFASILSTKLRGANFFKGAIFFPYLVCGIAIGFIFRFFFTHGFVFDTMLSWIGFDVETLPFWLRDERVNNVMLAATSVWRYLGQNMVLFLGAIMAVDPTMYEAASIDGASGWQKFWKITLPGIKSIVTLNIILAISGSISAFEPPFVITNGTFGTGTYFVIMNSMAHEKQKVGLASAMAVVLMLIIFMITIIQKIIMNLFVKEDESGMTFAERRAMKKRLRTNKGGA